MVKYSIFISVGTQLPFDRLIKLVESVFDNRNCELFFQVGIDGYKPHIGTSKETLEQAEYAERLKSCDLFICHCGTGSLVSAVEFNKPVICMPRLVEHREHRNNHQYDASRKLDGSVFRVVDSAEQLMDLLDELYSVGLKTNYGELVNNEFVRKLDSLVLEVI